MPVYSHSQLSTFEQCPLKFKYRYIDKIRKPEEKTVEAFTGSIVHETLQKLYSDLKYEKLISIEDLLAIYNDLWRRNWNAGIKLVREGLAEENYRDYGARCIRQYYERQKPFNQSLTLSTEAHLVFSLDLEGRYRFQGYIDRLGRREDGTYEIHDYKTASTLPDQSQVDHDRQLALYQAGLQTRWRDVERVELIWHYLAFNSTLVSRRTPEQIQDLTAKTIQLIGRIESTEDFDPVKNPLCDWCEYRPECPLWRHIVAVEAMPPGKMQEDEGVRLVNAYAQVKLQADRLEAQLATLRESILEYARERKSRVLQGNGFRLSISEREQITLPVQKDPKRMELESYVRSIGKWEEVSDLSASRVARVFKNSQWPDSWREQLNKFLRRHLISNLRLRRTGNREPEENEME